MNKIIFYLSVFSPKMPLYIVYMLQQVDYDYRSFLSWVNRSTNITKVMHRKKLDKTHTATILLAAIYVIWLVILVPAIYMIADHFIIFGIALLLTSPIIIIILLAPIIYFANLLIIQPRRQKLITKSEQCFASHSALKIAVAGSYGKTTMKELLETVLSTIFKVAVTPGNMNTPIAHARFVSTLKDYEDIIIIEYGEGAPTDVENFAKITHPDYAIITGLAPNHLDAYLTLNKLAEDIFSLRKFVKNDQLFIANNSQLIKKYLNPEDTIFTDEVALGWNISDIKVTITGLDFVMSKTKQKMIIHSGLIGRHQVAPLALVAALASKLGMDIKNIEKAISRTTAFEHRMQPYLLAGAWIVDDTYNGNIEGILAGLNLLKELKARRKIYVTPGLVEQGTETVAVHRKIGSAIAAANPDIVVLMDNSNTNILRETISKMGYIGEIRVEEDPLNFYQNLDQFVAIDDLVLMQNDWTDNYA